MAGPEMARVAAPAPDNERAVVAAGMHRLEHQQAGAASDRRKSKPTATVRAHARFPPQAFRQSAQ
jgi:hypothetical protein